jgi:hypothetical protein
MFDLLTANWRKKFVIAGELVSDRAPDGARGAPDYAIELRHHHSWQGIPI